MAVQVVLVPAQAECILLLETSPNSGMVTNPSGQSPEGAVRPDS